MKQRNDVFQKFGLRTQGLILVGTFLVVELALLISLSALLQNAEVEARQQEQAKKIVAQTNHLLKTLYASFQFLGNYVTAKDLNAAKNYEEARDDAFKTIKWLKKNLKKDAKNSKKQIEIFSHIEQNVNLGMKVMDAAKYAKESLPEDKALAAMQEGNEKIQPILKQLVADIPSFLEEERNYVDSTSPKKQRQTREATTKLIYAGIILNVIMALSAALLWVKVIIAKLLILNDNTQRLARGEQLNPVQVGADEISSLDQVFHKMAADLEESKQIRQAFVATITHELRTPLTAMSLFLELLRMKGLGDIPAPALKSAAKAETSVKRMIGLINDLLDMEKLASGKLDVSPKSFYLDDVFEKARDDVQPIAQKSKVKLEIQESNSEVFADPDRILQVLINLASNAVKFSPEGKSVILSSTEDEEWIEVNVADSGRGVPEKYKNLIFERFKQVESSDATQKGGTGLGLPICKAIIEQHGGKIGIRDNEGGGSIFWFKIPVKKEMLVSAEEPALLSIKQTENSV